MLGRAGRQDACSVMWPSSFANSGWYFPNCWAERSRRQRRCAIRFPSATEGVRTHTYGTQWRPPAEPVRAIVKASAGQRQYIVLRTDSLPNPHSNLLHGAQNPNPHPNPHPSLHPNPHPHPNPQPSLHPNPSPSRPALALSYRPIQLSTRTQCSTPPRHTPSRSRPRTCPCYTLARNPIPMQSRHAE